MKLLCTGDWHVNNFTDFSKTLSVTWDEEIGGYIESEIDVTSVEMNSRLFEILKGITLIKDYCKEHGIKDVLMTGDMFHKRGTLDISEVNPLRRVLKEFDYNGITIHAIAGNHDQVDASTSPMSSIQIFEDLLHVINNPTRFIIKDKKSNKTCNVVALPYSSNKDFVLQNLNKLHKAQDDVLMMHAGFDGGKVGSGLRVMKDEYTLGEIRHNQWKFVVLGHYHQPQELAENVFYCGSPLQNTFNDERISENLEETFNGFFVIDTEECTVEFVPITAPRFITVTDTSDVTTLEIREGDYVRDKRTNVTEPLIVSTTNIREEEQKSSEYLARSEIKISDTLQEMLKTYVKENYKGSNTTELLELGMQIISEKEE